jgi:hypothetical protein
MPRFPSRLPRVRQALRLHRKLITWKSGKVSEQPHCVLKEFVVEFQPASSPGQFLTHRCNARPESKYFAHKPACRLWR